LRRDVDLGVGIACARAVAVLRRQQTVGNAGGRREAEPRHVGAALLYPVGEDAQHHQVERPDDVAPHLYLRTVRLHAVQCACNGVVGHREVRGDRQPGLGLDLAENVPERSLRSMRAVLHSRQGLDGPLELRVDRVAGRGRRVQSHVLVGPHHGRNDHLVDEHVHADAAVLRLFDAVGFWLRIAGVDHVQHGAGRRRPLELVPHRPLPRVDHREVRDLRASGRVVVRHAADLGPIKLDRRQGVGVVGTVVAHRYRIMRQPPTLLGRRHVPGVGGRLKAEALRMPPQSLPKVFAERFDPVVVVRAPGSGGAGDVATAGGCVEEGRVFHARRFRTPDIKGRFAVARRAETVGMNQVVHVICVQMIDEDLVHSAVPDLRGGEVRRHPRAHIENKLIHRFAAVVRVARVFDPSHLDEDAHLRLRQAHGQRNHRAHERDPHLVALKRSERVEQRQIVEVRVALGVRRRKCSASESRLYGKYNNCCERHRRQFRAKAFFHQAFLPSVADQTLSTSRACAATGPPEAIRGILKRMILRKPSTAHSHLPATPAATECRSWARSVRAAHSCSNHAARGVKKTTTDSSTGS